MRRLIRFLRTHVWGELAIDDGPKPRRLAAGVWGGTLAVIGGVLAWYARFLGAAAALVGGAVLAILLLWETTGPAVYRSILKFFALVGWVVGHALLVLFFYGCVTPLGWLLRLMGKDFLNTSRRSGPQWKPHPPPRDRKRYYRLY